MRILTRGNMGSEERVFKLLKRLISEDDGATMVEYGVMLALIAAVCIAIIGTLGGKVNGTFQPVIDELP